MSASKPANFVAICPHCGAKAKARSENAGRPARCGRCRNVFELKPSENESTLQAADTAATPLPDPQLPPQPIGFDCRHCGTRLSVSRKYVGRKVKCPDCGVATVAPEPAAPRAPNMPAALDGEQYELYEGEDQPWAAELIAQQAALWPVICRQCQTLMHAQAEQEGQPLTCHDCGVATVIKRPPAPKAADRIGDDSRKDPAYAISPAESIQEVSEATRAYLQAAEAEMAEEAADKRIVTGPRPRPPRLPLVVGVFAFLRGEGMVTRIVVLSAWLAIASLLLAYALPALGGVAGSRVAVATGVVMGVCLLIGALMIGILWSGYFCALAMLIVSESSEGNDHIHDRPSPNPTDWFGETIYIAFACMAAAAPGWIIARFVASDPASMSLGAMASWILLFPLTHLSQLDLDSPWAVVSPQVLAALCRAMFSWLLFAIESTFLAAIPILAILATAQWGAWVTILAAPPIVVAGLVYFRLLGRLAWVLRAARE